MPVYRILTLPIILIAFACLYVVSIKMPSAVEMAGLLLWPFFGFIVIGRIAMSMVCRKWQQEKFKN